MKHHDPRRPVGKCKGCCLNQRTRCAAKLVPKTEWARGRCRHCGDLSVLARLTQEPPPEGAKLARLRRRAKAVQTASEPHYDGVLDPGKMVGRAKRRGH